MRGREPAGERIDASEVSAEPSSLLKQFNDFLDRPILDTGVRGGPLEPIKRFARLEPEIAQTVASVLAITFFSLVGRAILAVVYGV